MSEVFAVVVGVICFIAGVAAFIKLGSLSKQECERLGMVPLEEMEDEEEELSHGTLGLTAVISHADRGPVPALPQAAEALQVTTPLQDQLPNMSYNDPLLAPAVSTKPRDHRSKKRRRERSKEKDRAHRAGSGSHWDDKHSHRHHYNPNNGLLDSGGPGSIGGRRDMGDAGLDDSLEQLQQLSVELKEKRKNLSYELHDHITYVTAALHSGEPTPLNAFAKSHSTPSLFDDRSHAESPYSHYAAGSPSATLSPFDPVSWS